MFRAFRTARRKSSSFALALALVGGTALSTAAFATDAMAQQEISQEFNTVYAPVATMLQGEAPNYEAAKAQIDNVVAAITTENDRYAAGNLAVVVGNNLNDSALQRRGLEMMVQSGLVAAEQLPNFNYSIGTRAFGAQDWAAARAAFNAAIAAGYTDGDTNPGNDPEYLIIASFYEEGLTDQGAAYLDNLIEERSAAGQTIPGNYIRPALQASYTAGLTAESNELATQLVRSGTTPENWQSALGVMSDVNEFPADVQVDLYRLMRETGSLTRRGEYSAFIQALNPQVMGSEALAVIDQGIAENIYPADDEYVVSVRSEATPRAAADRRERDGLVSDGRSGNGQDAMIAGNVLLSLGDYATAAEMFELAVERGYQRETALTRLGIAQVMTGNHAEAQESFAMVSGAGAPVAQMWSLYAASQAS